MIFYILVLVMHVNYTYNLDIFLLASGQMVQLIFNQIEID